MGRKIIITRPIEQGHDFAKKLCSDLDMNADRFIFCPSTEIIYLPVSLPMAGMHDALVLTSVHAVNSLVMNGGCPNKLCYVVGEATARALQSIGGKDTIHISANVHDLVKVMKKSQNRSFLYVRGDHISYNIKDDMEGAGKMVEEVISYNARENDQIHQGAQAEIRDCKIGGVTLFSKRSTQIFYHNVQQAALGAHLNESTVFCISDAVAQLWSTLNDADNDAHIYVAKTPDMQGMIDLIKRFGVA